MHGAVSPEFLEDFTDALRQSRDSAVSGKYEDSLVFYDGWVSRSECSKECTPFFPV